MAPGLRITSLRIIIALFAFTTVAFIALMIALWSFSRSDRLCRNITIAGINVGGMTRSEATRVVERWARRRENQVITLTALDKRWKGTLKDLGICADVRKAVNNAYLLGRTGGLFERMLCFFTPKGRGKHIRVEFAIRGAGANKAISELAAKVDKPHRDARLIVIDGHLYTKPESYGIRLNRKEALKKIVRLVATEAAVIPLPVEADRPDITSRDAATIDTLLARYTTLFNPAKRDRTHNLKLAAQSISGTILKPGQEFSANETIGPREEDRGFRKAIIFVRGRMEEGLGGGTCQVSSTLYNAVLLSGLKVIERNHHSRTVPYVPPGLDATVAYGLVDFRFQNTNSAPIGIISTVKGNRLTVDIYGSAKDKKNVRIFTIVTKRMPAGVKIVTDHSLPPGARKLIEPASNGVSVIVYRVITAPDGTKKKEVVSRDRYLPQEAVIAIGPPIRAAQAR
jgi:vancomycin resistance protein VanW